MNISILIPSRNGVEFLQWSYNSIRKNQGNHFVEILVLDDKSDKDFTWLWCCNTMKGDPNFKAFINLQDERLGISGGYKFLAQQATQEIICHWHNDMFMTHGTLDAVEKELYNFTMSSDSFDMEVYKSREYEKVVCLTRIEPSIGYQTGPEKVIWENAPKELEDWDENAFLIALPILKDRWLHKKTNGHFAPFFMFREQYLELGGNDTITFPYQSREDSDWAFRLVLAGFKTIQIRHFTFHFCSRGNRRSKHNAGTFIDDPKWVEHNNRATRNFIRKWKTLNMHDALLQPYSPIVYDISLMLTNTSLELLHLLEPWFNHIASDLPQDQLSKYIEHEQPNTRFNLTDRLSGLNSGIVETHDIVVSADAQRFTQQEWNYIQNLSDILTDSGEIGSFQLGNLQITINALTHYEKDLIVCKNEPIDLNEPFYGTDPTKFVDGIFVGTD